MRVILSVVVSAGLASSAAYAQQVLKHEPPQGGMRSGEAVFVDNGKCPKGQIQKITAGYFAGGRNSVSGGGARQRECVPRP